MEIAERAEVLPHHIPPGLPSKAIMFGKRAKLVGWRGAYALVRPARAALLNGEPCSVPGPWAGCLLGSAPLAMRWTMSGPWPSTRLFARLSKTLRQVFMTEGHPTALSHFLCVAACGEERIAPLFYQPKRGVEPVRCFNTMGGSMQKTCLPRTQSMSHAPQSQPSSSGGLHDLR